MMWSNYCFQSSWNFPVQKTDGSLVDIKMGKKTAFIKAMNNERGINTGIMGKNNCENDI